MHVVRFIDVSILQQNPGVTISMGLGKSGFHSRVIFISG
jgi:hypothetical protein